MKRDQLLAEVKKRLPEKRWEHTLGVVRTAARLAERYGADPAKADLAAILHDYAKYWPVAEMERVIRERNLPRDLLEYNKELWHAPVGAYAASRDFGIEDREVLDAIRYHTSGRRGMTLLEKVVCLADYIEPGRNFPGVEPIRRLAEESLEAGLLAGFDSTIRFLIENGRKVYPLTLEARNALIDELNATKR